MKKYLLVIISLLILGTTLRAQDDARAVANASSGELAKIASTANSFEDSVKHWRITGILTLNASATGFVNWAAGGTGSVTGIAAANVSFLYKKGAIAWDTNIDADYGLSWVDTKNFPFRKTNDKFNLSTKFGWGFHDKWYLAALGSFRTQFSAGYSYDENFAPDYLYKTITSEIMTPSYTDLSVGIDWKPNDIFSLYLSPAAGRITTTTSTSKWCNFAETYLGESYVENYKAAHDGVAPIYKAEFGAAFKGQITYTKVENLKILSSVGIFTPYTAADHKAHIELDWDFSISYQFLKVLNVSFGTQMKYYDYVYTPCTMRSHADKHPEDFKGHRLQFKTMLGLGIGYSF